MNNIVTMIDPDSAIQPIDPSDLTLAIKNYLPIKSIDRFVMVRVHASSGIGRDLSAHLSIPVFGSKWISRE